MEIEFSGAVFEWRGPSPFHFVAVPEEESAVLESVSSLVTYGWGMIPVEVEIGSTRWTTSLYRKDDCYVVPLKTVIRRAESIEIGDVVTLHVGVAL